MSSPTQSWMVATPPPADERVTISDVAREAGVNKGTVSRALRGVPGVGDATRQRIVAAAERLQFSASRLATALATGTSHTIGIVLPTLRSWYFTAVAVGASEILIPSGFRVELINLDVDSDYLDIDSAEFRALFHELGSARGRDALLFGGTLSATSREGTAAARVPVAGPQLPIGEVPGIFIDHQAGGALMAAHLADLGHRHIVVLDGRMPHKHHWSVWNDRTQGFLDELQRRGIYLSADAVREPGDCGAEDGERAMRELLDSSEMLPTAVFCHTDEMAYGALAVLRQRGIDCPGQISVAGFDGHPMSRLFGLTTISQHASEQGARSAWALLEALGAPVVTPPGAAPVPQQIRVELVVRETTAAPRPRAGGGS